MPEITWATLTAVLAAPIVLLLPGAAVLGLTVSLPYRVVRSPLRLVRSPLPDLSLESRLALSGTLTLVIIPIALLLFSLLRLRVSAPAVLVFLALCALVAGLTSAVRARPGFTGKQGLWCLPRPDAPLIGLLIVLALVVGIRLWVVRGLNVGLWGDSYQHTMIAQLILDNGGLFQSWEPYAPLQTFTYHFGFHGLVALFQWATGWLTGNATPRTVVLVGQMVNALAALAVYPLAVHLARGNRWAGVVAVLVAGLLTPMPIYYINWGRYTQLTGQVILPVALWLTLRAVEEPHAEARWLIPAGLSVAALALTHYFVLAFYVAWLAPTVVAWLLHRRARWPLWRSTVFRLAAVCLLGSVLVLPWIGGMLQGLLPRILSGYVSGEPSAEHIAAENAFFPVVQFVPAYLIAVAAVGATWALWKREKAAVVPLWVGAQFLLSNPHWLRLPGTGVVTNFTVEMSLYLPVAVLAGWLVGRLVRLAGDQVAGWQVRGRLRTLLGVVAMALLLICGMWGAEQGKDVIDPQFQLVTPADEQAMAWIRLNTPPQARFLVNSFFAYGDALIVGSDAGWWIPLLAGRENTVPPLNYGGEAGPYAGYALAVNDLARRIETADWSGPAVARALAAERITHIFVGEKGGPLLDPAELRATPGLRAVYRPAEGVAGPWVFEVVP